MFVYRYLKCLPRLRNKYYGQFLSAKGVKTTKIHLDINWHYRENIISYEMTRQRGFKVFRNGCSGDDLMAKVEKRENLLNSNLKSNKQSTGSILVKTNLLLQYEFYFANEISFGKSILFSTPHLGSRLYLTLHFFLFCIVVVYFLLAPSL